METTPVLMWLPGAVAIAGAILGLLLDSFGRVRAARMLVGLGLAGAAATAGWAAAGEGVAIVAGGVMLGGGGFSALVCVAYAMAALSVLSGVSTASEGGNEGTVAGLTALGAVAVHVLASAFDLIIAVLALETLAVVAYALVSAARTRRSDEAAMRYFVQGGVAAAFMMLGLAVIYGIHGATNYGELVLVVDGTARPVAFGMVLLLAAFAFKLGAVPFHSWAPDVYETARPDVAAFLASAPKIGALTALLIAFPGGMFSAETTPGVTLVLAVVATASIVLGNLGGLRQTHLGRLLGYSGVAQVGYAMVGVASGQSGIAPTTVFAVTYAVGVSAAFLCMEAIHRERPGWDGSIEGLKGLAGDSPLLAAGMTAVVLSLTGVPLFIGFWGKLLVFVSAVSADLTWLAIVGVVGSVVSFGYYGRIIRAMYTPGDEVGQGSETRSTSARLAAYTGIALVIIGGLAPVVGGVDLVYRLLAF